MHWRVSSVSNSAYPCENTVATGIQRDSGAVLSSSHHHRFYASYSGARQKIIAKEPTPEYSFSVRLCKLSHPSAFANSYWLDGDGRRWWETWTAIGSTRTTIWLSWQLVEHYTYFSSLYLELTHHAVLTVAEACSAHTAVFELYVKRVRISMSLALIFRMMPCCIATAV